MRRGIYLLLGEQRGGMGCRGTTVDIQEALVTSWPVLEA